MPYVRIRFDFSWWGYRHRRLEDGDSGSKMRFELYAEKQKNEEGTDRASGMKQQSNRRRHFVSAYRSSS